MPGANGRNSGAKFWLPGESEWYKAAYHQPAGQGGDTDNYWLLPTRSNRFPTVATADATGNINNGGSNIANDSSGAGWNGQDGNVTTVGSAGPGSASYYSALDLGGNLWEWNEQKYGSGRGMRGGSWSSNGSDLRSFFRLFHSPSDGRNDLGFRVAGP